MRNLQIAHLRSKDFSFQTKYVHSASPSAGEAGELYWKITRDRMSSRRRSMCGRLWPDSRSNTLVRTSDTVRERWKSISTSDAKSEKKVNRCTRIVRAIGNEVLTAAKSFQRQAIGGSNERRQPFFGCSLDANAFSLIPKEFYLIDEHFCGSEPV